MALRLHEVVLGITKVFYKYLTTTRAHAAAFTFDWPSSTAAVVMPPNLSAFLPLPQLLANLHLLLWHILSHSLPLAHPAQSGDCLRRTDRVMPLRHCRGHANLHRSFPFSTTADRRRPSTHLILSTLVPSHCRWLLPLHALAVPPPTHGAAV